MTTYNALQARIASRLMVLVLGISVFGIGSATLIGYASGFVGLWQWTNNAVGMAPNTGVGFVLSGLSISVIAASNRVWRC